MHASRFVPPLIVLWIVLASAPGYAQRGRGGIRPQPMNTTGTIRAISPKALQIIAEDGSPWIIALPERRELLVYHGTAPAQWLQRGMFVRFTATLDKRLETEETVRELVVVTVRPGVEPGVFPEADAAQLLADAEQNKKTRKKKRQPPPDTPVPCLVIGRLYGYKNGEMTVAAGRLMVKAPLAEDAKVTIEVNDHSLARPGDKVEVSALFFLNAPGRATARQMKITAAGPLAADQDNKGRRRGRKAEGDDPPPKKKRQRGSTDKGKDKDG